MVDAKEKNLQIYYSRLPENEFGNTKPAKNVP